MKLILLIAALIFFNLSLNAATYYVNGEYGSDTANTNAGLTEKKAFKSISYAVSVAKRGDIIRIAGKSDTAQIIYKESIAIPIEKEDLRLIGVDSPVLDGSTSIDEESLMYGILSEARGVVIEGFIIRKYLGKGKNQFDFDGSAAILLHKVNTCSVVGNKIDSCNWGILAIESEYCNIQNNTIRSIIAVDDSRSINSGGIGMMFINRSETMQKHLIGTDISNTIDFAHNVGIWFGTDAGIIFADQSQIKNNRISRTINGPGLFLSDLEGTIAISKNTFRVNHHALEIQGVCIDTWISENIFEGSISKYEVKTDEKYRGSIIYDIWKSNNNEFSKATYAAIKRRNNIELTDGYRYIWNDKDSADIYKENTVIEESVGTKGEQ